MVTRTRPWHGIMVATALPFRSFRNDLSVDYDAYAEHVARLLADRLRRRRPQRLARRVPDAHRRRAGPRRRDRRRAAGDGDRVMPGVAAYGSAEVAPLGRAGRRGGLPVRDAAAAQRLPGRRAAVVRAHYAEVAKAGPAGRRLQQPLRHQGRPDPGAARRAARRGAHRRRQGVQRRRPPGLRDRRTRPGTRPVDRRRRRPAGARPGRRRRLGRRLPERAARAPASPCTGPPSPATSPPRCPSTAPLHPLLRWDSKTEFVQAIKLSMDLAGRHGGPPARRARRSPPSRTAAVRAATEKAASPTATSLTHGARTMRSDTSSTPSTRTPRACPPASITGGVGTIPGATMAERRLHFLEHRDHIRTLLMYEPRGHAAMSGAILQPPTRPDADYGVAVHRGLRLPADVRARHDRRGHRARRDRHGRGRRAGHHDPARHPGRAGRRRGAGARTARPRPSPSATCPPSAPASTARSTCPGYGTVTYDLAYGGNFYAILPLDALGLPFDRARKDDILAAGLALMDADQRRRPSPSTPRTPAIGGSTTSTSPRPAPTPATPGTRWPSTPAGSTARPAAPAPARAWPSCTRAANSRCTSDFVNESFIGTRVHRPARRRRPRSAGCPAVVPTVTGRAWITGTAQYFLDPADPFPGGFLL